MILVCSAADTASLATWVLFGKLFGVAMLVGFGEKRCRKNLPLDTAHVSFGGSMRFQDIHVDTVNRFSLGFDRETKSHYVSIPVSNRLVDYEEYYQIEQSLVDGFPASFDDVMAIVSRCRNRELDDQLIIQPGSDRGVAS